MLVKVFKWFFFGFLALLLLLLLTSGFTTSVFQSAESFASPIKTGQASVPNLHDLLITAFNDLSKYRLPGQSSISVPQGPSLQVTYEQTNTAGATQQSQADFGTPSPYENAVNLQTAQAGASDPTSEYLVIYNSGYGQIDIAGWSLQSALTGVRMYIPAGVNLFKLGALNSLSDIVLPTGGSAIITSGPSPVGVSFRENECSGYLNELQRYTPSLSRQCPSPSESITETGAGLSILGSDCYDYVQQLSSCHFPQSVPGNLNASCRLFISDNFSYNGCVDTYRNSTSFEGSTWRIYLGSPVELWQNQHDIIRLLDANGRTVSVVRY